jgi:DNA-binding NtrC family response regulator
MRLGATEYLTKPFALDALGALVDRSVRRYAEDRHTMAEGTPVAPTFSGHLVGKSPAMVELFKMVGKLAMSDIPVLVIGESGSGKELAARALHMYGRYSAGAFIPVDCAGIPASLLESELFGYERGAFTDAREAKPGRFEAADGGTLFLDEVGNIPLEVQSKLLRAVQDRATQRLGSNRAVPWRARIVCATNSNLRRMAGEGRFREDLFYRIAGAELVIPPLRERREDIPLLAVYFLGRISGNGRRFSAGAMEALAAHDWPGNVRELEHTVGRAAAVANGPVIGTDDLPAEVLGGVRYGDSGIAATPASIYPMAEMKRRHARECLRICGGDRKKAARMLGIHVKTLDSLTRVQGGGAGADGEAGRGLAQR